MTQPSARSVIAALAFAAAPFAEAARPMITDDARTVDPKACQLESWTRFNRESTEFWALPACNVTGNLELTFGGARTREDGDGQSGTRTTDIVMQAKTILKPLAPNGWGIGLAAGNVRHPPRGDGFAGDVYAYVPISVSLRDDRMVIHANLGWLRERGDDATPARNKVTMGLAMESQLSPRIGIVAETFGQNEGRASYQAGLRFWLVPDRVQVDATFGNRFGRATDERWVSLGLRLLSPPFLR